MWQNNNLLFKNSRRLAAVLLVLVLANSVPSGILRAAGPSVDLKVNGSDGPVTLNTGDTYTYTWNSNGASACQMTSPVISGVSLAGTSDTIDSGNTAFYPTAGLPVTLSISCTDGTTSATDSVTINLANTATSTEATSTPTVDVKVNGSDGPVTLNPGDTFTYTWNSNAATACQMTSPVISGVSLAGTSVTIDSGNTAFYPTAAVPTTITVSCSNGSVSATDSVIVNLGSGGGGGGGGGSSAPTVDVKANGSDGPVTINSGDTYTYTWNSNGASACQMTSPATSGVSLAGSSDVIGPDNAAFYPKSGSPVTLTISCNNGSVSATDSVVVQLASGGGGGGGGGGGSSSGGGGSSSSGGGSSSLPPACPLIKDYMRIDFNNNPWEVAKLQAFLKVYMGYSYVNINGVFDQATYTAVGQFQNAYKSDILTPWGHTAPTHYVYILTLKKVNELFCNHSFPLTAEQQHEIVVFRNLITSQSAYTAGVRSTSRQVGVSRSGSQIGQASLGTSYQGSATTSSSTINSAISGGGSISGSISADDGSKGQISNLTAALFSLPSSVSDWAKCLYEFVLIVVVLYLIGNVLKDVLYSDLPENEVKRFFAKWITIAVGLIVAIYAAYAVGQNYLLLPLVLTLIFVLIWMIFYPREVIEIEESDSPSPQE